MIAVAIAITAVSCCIAGAPPASELTAAIQQGNAPTAIAAKREAFEAFRRGDATAGVAALKKVVDSDATGQSTALRWAAIAGEMAFSLKNSGESRRAAAVAALALEQAADAKTRLSRSDLAELYSWMGELNERILGRTDDARKAYESALKLDPDLPLAKARAARLKTAEVQANAQAQYRQNQTQSSTR